VTRIIAVNLTCQQQLSAIDANMAGAYGVAAVAHVADYDGLPNLVELMIDNEEELFVFKLAVRVFDIGCNGCKRFRT